VGLDDASPIVVHTALQALAGVRDQRLFAAYGRVRDRFKTDEYSVLTNLELRLKEMATEPSPIGPIERFGKWMGAK
jgi:hypothetical protein